jgi:anti-repressor protein
MKGVLIMNELIKVNYENANRPTVSGRELHTALEVKTAYKDWFPRMVAYGFTENVDYQVKLIFEPNSNGGKQSYTDHEISLDMAKEICMIQRTEKGKQFRQYFIEVEKAWNSPEMVMGRALQIAQRQLDEIKARNLQLTTTVAVQSQQIAELQPKASYYDIVLNCKDLVSTSIIAKDFGKSAVWLNNYLHDKGVQYKQGGIWLLYQKYAEQGYTGTKTNTYNGIDGSQHIRVHTYWTQKGRLFIYGMLKNDDYVPVIERKGRDTINESL